MKPWREASSLLFVAKVAANDNEAKAKSASLSTADTDFNILMTKRSGKSSFMASAYVFPGGHVDVADFSPLWWSVFESHGIAKDELRHFSQHIVGPRPPIVTQPLTIDSTENLELLPTDIALRVTAIRETFEETGVLLLSPAVAELGDEFSIGTKRYSVSELNEWRLKVQSNALLFVDFCAENGSCPDIWSLFEWWNWLTPETLGHKRFDTIFYICCVEAKPKTKSDEKEVTLIEWNTPKKMLEEHSQKRAFLAPPQVYELSRLSGFRDFKSLRDFAIKREKLGVQRWSPKCSGFKDGVLLAFPGDDAFEKVEDSMQLRNMPSLQEHRLKMVNLNRIEMVAPICTVHCNVKVTCGHQSPITYPTITSVVQPRL